MAEDLNNLTKKERRELKKQQEQEWEKHQEKSRITKRIALWSLLVLGIGGIVFGTMKFGGESSSDNQSASLIDTVSQTDWFKGSKDGKAVLVEYSDFQCPACGFYYPLVKQLGEEFGDKIAIVYRHFPLPQHKNAKTAAYVAESAGRQEKFWDMHDMMFENQNKWSEDSNAKDIFTGYAESFGLDMDKFKSDIESKEIKDKVENDYNSGVRSKVNSTPTFFLNGEKIQNPKSYDEFKNIISDAIGGNS